MAIRSSIDELACWLREHDDYVLIGHVSPDGDAAGSCFAAMLALQAIGKRAFVCLPNSMCQIFGEIFGAFHPYAPQDAKPFTPRTALVLDVGDEFRMGEAITLYQQCEHKALMDHHDTNAGFGDVFVVDSTCSATAEMVFQLIRALGVELTREMAICLYVAISTDSGHFSYENTTSGTMRIAAELIACGIDFSRIARTLYKTRSLKRTLLTGQVISGIQLACDGRVAWAKLTGEMLGKAGAESSDNEGIVNYLLEVEGVEGAVLAEERKDCTKFSLRAKEYLDVARVARRFGGGGHVRSAGCTIQGDMDAAIGLVLDSMAEALKEAAR